MSAREVCALSYALLTEGRTAEAIAELDEFLETDPDEMAKRRAEAKALAIARMGGRVETTGGGE